MTQQSGGVFLREDGSLDRVELPSGGLLRGEMRPHIVLAWEDGTEMDSRSLRWTARDEGREFCGEAPGIVEFRILIEDDPFGPLLLWRPAVRNLGPCRLDRVDITLVAFADVPDDWLCTMPFAGGWAVRLSDLAPESTVSLRYPVQGSMQWIELCGEYEGFTFQTRDPVPWLKDFVIRRTQNGLRLIVTHRHLQLAEGETLELPGLAVGSHGGDWQEGAAIYSRWLRSVMPDPAEAPEWLARAGGWAWISGKGQYAPQPDNRFSDLPERSEEYARCGVECLHLAAWFEHGHDTRYPDYVAGDCLGGEQALGRAVADIHRTGRRLALYTNARLLDPLSATAGQHPEWPRWAVHAPAGKTVQGSIADELAGVTTDVELPEWDPGDRLLKEIYGKVVFAVMCPGSPEWRETFAGRIERAAAAYRPDGFYLDQVLGAVTPPCFADGHEHQKPYEAWARYLDLVAEVRRRVKSILPQAYLATEGISDILSQHFDVVQSHNDWRGPCPEGSFPLPEMTRHAIPWLLQANGAVYADRMDLLALAHACAGVLDLACFSRVPQGEFARAVRFALDVRHRFGERMLRARPVRMHVAGFPRQRAMALVGDGLFLCSATLGGEPQDYHLWLDIAPGRLAAGLRWESPEGEGILTATPEGSGIRLRIPASELGFVYADLRPVPEAGSKGAQK